MKTRSQTHEETFPLAPAEMFALLCTPSCIRNWWSAASAIVIPEEGGLWAATWGGSEDSPEYIASATIRAYEPPRRLLLATDRYFAKSGPLPFRADLTTEFTVQSHADGAVLKVLQAGFPDERAADAFYAACGEGWRETFAGIRRHVEEVRCRA